METKPKQKEAKARQENEKKLRDQLDKAITKETKTRRGQVEDNPSTHKEKSKGRTNEGKKNDEEDKEQPLELPTRTKNLAKKLKAS